MSVTKRDPKLDFFSYWFYPEGADSAILYAYAGNHPSFLDNVPVGSRIEQIKIGGLRGESVEWIDDSGLFYRETMIRLQGQFQVPQFVYFRYGKLTKEQKEIADAIIQMTRPGSE
jgi:hypothetical protein